MREGWFELVAIGNAFHRLRRHAVAASALRWLRPGGCLALLWADSPWRGEAAWQRVMSATLDQWMTRVQAHERIPAGWDQIRRQQPDMAVIEASGFEPIGSYSFPAAHAWTSETLIGFVYSASFLSRESLGDLAGAFEADLRHELHACEPSGVFQQTIDFAYEIARRPIQQTAHAGEVRPG